MSRFNHEIDFFYQNNGSNFFAGTQLHLEYGQMPNYPFPEYRVNDKVTLRNLNGDAYTYQNYNKVGYTFSWSLLDESAAVGVKAMLDANPIISIFSNAVNIGTFIVDGEPQIQESQFELYDINFNLIER
jgi:hypothetical protein